jgi:hypothetical protein
MSMDIQYRQYGVRHFGYRQVHIYPKDVFKRWPGRGRSADTEGRQDGGHRLKAFPEARKPFLKSRVHVFGVS